MLFIPCASRIAFHSAASRPRCQPWKPACWVQEVGVMHRNACHVRRTSGLSRNDSEHSVLKHIVPFHPAQDPQHPSSGSQEAEASCQQDVTCCGCAGRLRPVVGRPSGSFRTGICLCGVWPCSGEPLPPPCADIALTRKRQTWSLSA